MKKILLSACIVLSLASCTKEKTAGNCYTCIMQTTKTIGHYTPWSTTFDTTQKCGVTETDIYVDEQKALNTNYDGDTVIVTRLKCSL